MWVLYMALIVGQWLSTFLSPLLIVVAIFDALFEYGDYLATLSEDQADVVGHGAATGSWCGAGDWFSRFPYFRPFFSRPRSRDQEAYNLQNLR